MDQHELKEAAKGELNRHKYLKKIKGKGVYSKMRNNCNTIWN